MGNKTINTHQGHWILAKMGKRVLRPGGRELTQKLIQNMHITVDDDVVEFAPGMGFTAGITLGANPHSYTGVELNEEAAARLRKIIHGDGREIIIANAANSTLEPQSRTKVYGEAMLTMQADHRKSEIIQEAYRILKPGGLYGIHELGLCPDDISEDKKAEIQRALAEVIKVNARPMTQSEWSKLLVDEGFKIMKIDTNPMHLLEMDRMIDDEGLLRTLMIGFNILTHADARKRIMAMRKVFRKYQENMNAISIVVQKV